MLKQLTIAKLIGRVAEQQLRGCKAYAWRVMAEWLRTPYVVLSRDLSLTRLDSSLKFVGKPINPTKDAYCNNIQVRTCINSNEADYIGHTKTTNL